MRHSNLDRAAQTVERDASNIKVVISILTAVKVLFTFPVETHSLESQYFIKILLSEQHHCIMWYYICNGRNRQIEK